MHALFLAAALAFHQPVLGPELLSAPQPPANPTVKPEVSIAADRGSAVLAWATGDHLYVDVLSIDGRLGEATAIPANAPVAPSIVAFRGGYLLAWVETALPERAIVVRLTAALQPMQQQTISATNAELRSDGTNAFLLISNTAYSLAEDGALNTAAGIDAGDDIAVMGSNTSAHLWHTVEPCGHFNWGCGGTDLNVEVNGPNHYERLIAVHTTTGLETITGPAAIAFDGRRLLVACYVGDSLHRPDVRASVQVRPYDAEWLAPPITIGSIWDASPPVRPGIAGDGRRFVVVWRTWNGTNFDVAGAVIDNGTFEVAPLDIASGPNDEEGPGIAAIAPGRFLITWTSISATERRLAARFLDFGETPVRVRPSH
jgi:hypothetical protein